MSDASPRAAERPGAAGLSVGRTERRFEIVATVILAFAALATAWSGYQASLWDGIQSSKYSQASAMRTESAQQATAANQLRLADLSVLEGYLQARTTGNEELADFYLGRVRPEAQPAFDEWLAQDPLTNPDAATNPFVLSSYKLATLERSEALDRKATATFAEGEDANTYSDVFTLATLLFASALFFAAISERFAFVPARSVLLGLAALGLLTGLVVSFTQPITTG